MSRYAGYDTSLLTSAPVVTKLQLQAEYSTDPKMPSPQRQNLDGVEPTPPAVPFRSRPFYRTKRGIIIILIVFIALLAVIVGAVVGSKKKSSEKGSTSNPANATPTRTTTTPSVTPSNLSSKTFTWTRSGVLIPTTSVFPPGIEFTIS